MLEAREITLLASFKMMMAHCIKRKSFRNIDIESMDAVIQNDHDGDDDYDYCSKEEIDEKELFDPPLLLGRARLLYDDEQQQPQKKSSTSPITRLLYDDEQQQPQKKSSTSPKQHFDLDSRLVLGDLTENTTVLVFNVMESSPAGNTSSTASVTSRQKCSFGLSSTASVTASSASSSMHGFNTGEGNDNGRDLKYYLPLYKAALNGDWETAKRFFSHDPDAVTAEITCFSRTALHVAAGAGHLHFVKELVELMPPEALALQEANIGATALHFAVVTGITEAAEVMVKKNRNLTQITVRAGGTPLLVASAYASSDLKDMVWYLCTVTRDESPSPYSGIAGAKLGCNMVAAGFFDIALYLIQRHPNLATARDKNGYNMLEALSERPSAFPSGTSLGYWQRYIYSIIPLEMYGEPAPHAIIINLEKNLPAERSRGLSIRGFFTKFFSWTYLAEVPGIKNVYQTKLEHIQALQLVKCICQKISLLSYKEMSDFFSDTVVLRTASKLGIVELVTECLETFPDQIWFCRKGKSIFHIAVEHRRVKIFNLMFGMSAHNKMLAARRVESDNNILHVAAKLAPSAQLNSVSGAALQMQRELRWYKEVENIVQPIYKDMENQNKETPRDVFTKEHQTLVEKGEKWMKDTAQSCMVVGTLVATIAFAAAFTVPGGNINDSNNNDNGIPIFLHDNAFMVFIIADALGLFSSSTSVLMFLSILTSRYAEEDFLYTLPRRLVIGLATLFLSIAGMMMAFTAAISIVLGHKLAWASFPIAVLACFPVALFALLQFPLLVEIVNNTYGHGIFQADSKYKVY